ncbi:MAG TPA: hypothetical protein VL172_21150, partial [Kofleriaceae bacterium]|nr:hypothetical protein [Kofleriaceae bacterium]
QGHCDQAIPLFKSLHYPDPSLSDSGELAEAHVVLGICQLRGGEREEADREFWKALKFDVDITIDPGLDKPASERLEEIRKRYKQKQKDDDEKRKLAEERDALKRALANMVVIEKRPYYVNFIPFGAGQFQNGDEGWGLFFSVSEGVTGATSAILWAYQVLRWGFPIAPETTDANTVTRIQQVQVTTGIACLALIGAGIIHALMNYQPTVQRKPDESLLPDHLREKPAPPPKRSLLLLPTPDAHGASLQLTWRF